MILKVFLSNPVLASQLACIHICSVCNRWNQMLPSFSSLSACWRARSRLDLSIIDNRVDKTINDFTNIAARVHVRVRGYNNCGFPGTVCYPGSPLYLYVSPLSITVLWQYGAPRIEECCRQMKPRGLGINFRAQSQPSSTCSATRLVDDRIGLHYCALRSCWEGPHVQTLYI